MITKHSPIKALDKWHLQSLVNEHISTHGEDCSLAHIDVSDITDMSTLFESSNFYGDISTWDVSNVTNMNNMFFASNVQVDISKWDVSNVTNMEGMFGASEFNGDISEWDVSNVTSMGGMFSRSTFTGDLSKWDVSNVRSMYCMFAGSKFNGDISNWDVSKVETMCNMFNPSEFQGDLSKWRLDKLVDARQAFSLTHMNTLKHPNVFVWLPFEYVCIEKPLWREHFLKMKPILEALYPDPVQMAIACHTRWMEIEAAPNIDPVSVSNMELEIHV